MSNSSPLLKINWSVWDNSPIVSWTFDGVLVDVKMKIPPIAVSHLQSRGLIAVVGNFSEFGSANLLLYFYDGTLRNKITAPDIGENAQFGAVLENNEEIQAIVGFQVNTFWKEEAGLLNIDSGIVTNIHRSY